MGCFEDYKYEEIVSGKLDNATNDEDVEPERSDEFITKRFATNTLVLRSLFAHVGTARFQR